MILRKGQDIMNYFIFRKNGIMENH